MIPFFRKIRYRLAEDNQFFKYSRYAIGEIVLVVVGILIALQINNWNEDRKVRNQADLYKARLIIDLESDTTNIVRSHVTRSESIKNTQAYFDYFESSGVPIKSLIDTVERVKYYLYRYIPIDYTFRDMENSGRLNLLNTDIQKLLLELSNKQKFAQLSSEKLMDDFYKEASLSSKYFGRKRPQSDRLFYDIVGVEKSEEYYAQGLLHRHNMLQALTVYHMVQINIENEIKTMSGEIINALKAN